MTRSILSYSLNYNGLTPLSLPSGTDVLSVTVERNSITVWVSSPNDHNMRFDPRQFWSLAPNTPVPDGNLKFIGTVSYSMPTTQAVRHIFEQVLTVK